MKITAVCQSVLLLMGFTLSNLYADVHTVTLQVNESSPYWTGKKTTGGFGGEVVDAISKEIGLESRIEFIPLKRLIADTSNNDVGNPLFYMNNQDFSAIIPIGVMYSTVFTYRKDARQMAINMMNSKNRIGILNGTIDNPSSMAAGQFEVSYSKESLFKKLKKGRIDAAIELSLVGHEVITQLFPKDAENFDEYTIPESAAPIAILIDSKYPAGAVIGKRYRDGFHRIVKKGIYQKILQKYYGKNPIPEHYYGDIAKFEKLYASDEGDGGL